MANKRYVFDLSVSRAYAGRPAVGIIRVEREMAEAISRMGEVEFVYYDPKGFCFRTITQHNAESYFPADATGTRRFRLVGGDYLTDVLEYGAKFFFNRGDVYINCGLPWGNDVMLCLYEEKKRTDIFVVQVLYDIIPVLMPELCVPGMQSMFPRFIIDMSFVADAVFSISDSTRSDLEKFLRSLDLRIPELPRIQMGIDPIANILPAAQLARSDDFDPAGEVVYVSSFEPRKNHQLLFNVWQELFRRHGSSIPQLVLVGSRGWNTENLMFYIQNSDVFLQKKVVMRHHLSDGALSSLYQRSLFTVYPSLYEGWGLPISESIAYGKMCIASNTSSMPEAGQGLIELLNPRDFLAWCDVCERYMLDRDLLTQKEISLKAKRQLRSWPSCAKDFVETIKKLVS